MEDPIVKKILPHSYEAEQAVIGSMIMDPDALWGNDRIVP